MSDDADQDQPIKDLSAWSIECLEASAAGQQGQHLEQIRVVAQSHAYRSDEDRQVRLRWAKLALNASERLPGDSAWDRARKARQNFALRAWIIGHLGPDDDPDWNPDSLATDTLAAITVDPGLAVALSANWRDLPIEQISELRRHKEMTAHLERLMDLLSAGPTKDHLNLWMEARRHLP